MPIGEPPTYEVRELEQRAEQFLAEHSEQPLSIPVDVDLLLERLPGVDLDIWRDLRDTHRLEGMVMREPETGKLFIFIDEWLADNQPTRYRMTVAEELAHLILHRELIGQINRPGDFRELQQHYRWHTMERNAKRLAAAVLMPAKFIVDESNLLYPRLVHTAGYDNPEAIRRTLAAALAKKFSVSTQAMTIRLKEWPMKVYERVDEALQERMDYLR